MHSPNIFVELSLVIALGAGVSAIMRLIRQPLLIGYIITGVIAGPILGIVKSADTLEGFSKIGIALLLFIVGLGLNPKLVKELGKVAFFTGFAQIALSTLFGTIIMMLLGQSFGVSLVVGVSLAFSSTIVGLKLLTDKREQNRLYGRVAIGVLLVQDIIATIALLVLSVQSEGFSFGSVGSLIFKGALIGVPLFFISNKVLPKYAKFLSSSTEFLFLFTLAWGFGIGNLFEWAGFSLEIGALIAGVSLASLHFAQEAGARLRPVRDFFIVIFFIFLGANIRLEDISSQLPLALLFSGMILITNPLAIMLPLGFFGHTKRNSFKVGIMMAQVSEFSLIFIVLARNNGVVGSEIVSMLTLTALITIAVSTYAITYDDQLFKFFQKYIRFFEGSRQNKRERRTTYDIVQFGYNKGGFELMKMFEKLPRNNKTILIDYNPDVIENLERQKINYLYGDATDIELLDEVGVDQAKVVVSTIGHFPTNKFLIEFLTNKESGAVIILLANSAEEAAELYGLGASYVMVPHYVGTERLSSFIGRHGFKKREFEKHKEKHLAQLHSQYQLSSLDEPPEVS